MKIAQHKWFFLIYVCLVLFVIKTSKSWEIYKEHPYQFVYGSDVNQYYGYLPAFFIHDDLSFQYTNDRAYWLIKNEKGIALPKMTMGMSILYSPFFLAGHAVALNTSYEADGYSKPYSIANNIGTYIYVSIGLYLIYLSLLFFFKPWISSVSVFLIFVSTNLYYYTLCEGGMSHSYLFFLFSIIIYNTIKWFSKYKVKNLLFLALAFGMSVLIRPTSAIIVLFPLFYAIHQTDFISHLKSYYKRYIVAVILFFIPLFIQMLYWKVYGETWTRWSYGDEKFFFGSPHLIDFLFSYRKGWLVYTPIMLFSIIGMFYLRKKVAPMKWSIPLISLLAVYILSSWWCWWFGGSYGSRSMVEFYAFLIFPLAAFIDRISTLKFLNYAFIAVFGFTTFYNVLGTHKKTWWQLHWDSMTKEAFWITFSQIDVDYDTKQKLDKAYRTPDYDNAKKGLPERETE